MEIRKIAVIGGGLMGGGIAHVAIEAGYDVILNDVSMEFAQKSKDGIVRWMDKDIAKGRMTAEAKEAALSHLTLSCDLEDIMDVDLVIEAIPEKIELKKSVFSKLSKICREETILATNTSAISIAEIASVVKKPERVLGMHFVSPVQRMKLMEIVKTLATSEETIAYAREVAAKMGKTVIVAKDSPAFILNRMLDPMANEAITIVELGIGSIEDVDTAMRVGLNHPVGPLELMDMAGLNVLLDAINAIHNETNDPKYKPSMLLRNMVRMGWWGKKTGKGFYIYHEDGTKTPNPDIDLAK